MTRWYVPFCLTLFVLLLCASAADAVTYWVKKTGSDGNTCTQAQTEATPKLTINAGINCIGASAGAGANDTVIVGNGTYAEVINNTMPSGTSWTAPFTLKAQNARGAILRPTTTGYILTFRSPAIKFVIIDGFVLDGTNVGAGGVRFNPDTTGVSSRIRFINNEFKDISLGAPTGVSDGSGVSDHETTCCNEYINNEMHDIGNDRFEHAVYLKSSQNLVERNLVYNISGAGISVGFSGSVPTVNDNIIRYNISFNSGMTGDVGEGILIQMGARNQLYNNIVYGSIGGLIARDVTDTKIFNNTIVGNNSPRSSDTLNSCIRIQRTTNLMFKNNICWDHDDGVYDIRFTSTGLTQSNNLCSSAATGCTVANPLFVNLAANDFRLQATSPAINAGTPTIATGVTVAFPSPNTAPAIGAYQPWFLVSGKINGTSFELNFNTLRGPVLPTTITGWTARYDDDCGGAGAPVNAPITSCARTADLKATCTMSAQPTDGNTCVDVSYSTSTGNMTDSLCLSNDCTKSQRLNAVTNVAVTNETGGGPPPAPGALQAHWPLDEGTGTSLNDQSGHGHTLIFAGGTQAPTWTATGCPIGTDCLSFDGGDYASAVDAPSLNMIGDFTVAVWIDSSQAAAVGLRPTLVRKTAGSPAVGYRLVLHDEATAAWRGEILIGGSVYTVQGASDVADGAAHHLVLVRRGSNLEAWQNGVLANTTVSVSTASLSNTGSLFVGAISDLNPNFFYHGLMNDIQISDYALTQAEIEALAAQTPPVDTATSVQVQYRWQMIDARAPNKEFQRQANRYGEVVEGNQVRLLTAIARVGSASISQAYNLHCRTPFGSGTYAKVTDSSDPMRYGTDRRLDSSDLLTQQFTIPGFTYQSGGAFIEAPGGSSTSIALDEGEWMELLHALRASPTVTVGNTIGCCQFTDLDQPLESCVEAELRVVAPSGVTGGH